MLKLFSSQARMLELYHVLCLHMRIKLSNDSHMRTESTKWFELAHWIIACIYLVLISNDILFIEYLIHLALNIEYIWYRILNMIKIEYCYKWAGIV